MSNYSRRKGLNWERKLVQIFRHAMPGATIKRGLQYQSGQDAPDIHCPIFWLETKRGKKPNVRGALKQAQQTAPKGRIPLAVIRDDRKDPFVVLQLDDFIDFIREWWETQNQ